MLAAASEASFDVLLVEDTDRLARNREHDAHVFNRLSFAGVTISTPATEKVTVIESALKGLMNELYLVNLGIHTARGMRANAEKGLATGARIYGYKSQPGGAIQIIEAEAEVIREIYRRFAGGETAREIAADLNRRRVPATKGGTWAANAINGSRSRANGILHTELYAGVKVYNRLEVKKDPETGRRLPRIRPETEWQRASVPHLRIVPEDLWQAAVARKSREAALAVGETPEARKGRLAARRKGLFSGLLKCGCCGASYTSYNRSVLTCAAHREKGDAVCANAKRVRRERIEDRVLTALRTRLANPEAAKVFAQEYQRTFAEEMARRLDTRMSMERRLAEATRRATRLVNDICDGNITAIGRAKLIELEAERERLGAELAELERTSPPASISIHPSAPARYGRMIAEIHARLREEASAAVTGDEDARAIVEAVRDLVVRVDIISDAAAQDGVQLNLTGNLAHFLAAPDQADVRGRGRAVVAGGGLEPPTCGL